ITRLARGMPVGANLEFTDDVTLSQAFTGRQNFSTRP
ncbi:MAG TPA: recombination protein RecR, partial [bacterium]|nr:recombination protein RecR [bacterium]